MVNKPFSELHVAIVYDRVNKWGGAERLLLSLHRVFPDAPLFTSVYHPASAPWARLFHIHTSFIQKFPFLRSRHELIPFLMPFAFESFDFSDFDLVISVTSAEAKGIITGPQTLHICLCLTPTRYLWVMDPTSRYSRFDIPGPLVNLFKIPLIKLLKSWDMVAKNRPDAYIAISDLVKSRLKTFYSVDAPVVYPPLDEATQSKSSGTGAYFLIVSRLVGYKRVDLAIRVANHLGFNLKIVGTGSELRNLKKISGSTVEFVGFVPDSDLPAIYSGCRALLVPGEEEFCLAALEAQANGKPVIAFAHSGVAEIIRNGSTGLLFMHQTVEDLSSAISKFSTIKFDPANCKKNADIFSFAKFRQSLIGHIRQIRIKHEQKLSR